MTAPTHDATVRHVPRGQKVDLSSLRSLVFDRQFRRSIGTDHGFENLTQGRAELVVSRITTTISIARQGPSAFFISAGGPALRRKSSRLAQIFRRDNSEGGGLCLSLNIAGLSSHPCAFPPSRHNRRDRFVPTDRLSICLLQPEAHCKERWLAAF